MHSADPRRDPRGHSRGDEARRSRRDLHPRRRPGGHRHGGRHETIAPVNLIAGPGNAYVAEAKRQLFGEIGIDLFAGPTEILIVADDDADPFLTAVDLLRAPSTVESPAVLITTSRDLGEQVLSYIEKPYRGCRPRTTPSRRGGTGVR